jgi:succinate-acetate transporter protein
MEQLEVRSTDNIKNTPIKKTKEYDEPFLFFALSNIAFSAGTFLLGLINFYSYNPLFLTIFGFWFPGWGQALGGIMSYKIKYYMDGNIYFFFAINWFCNFCYDLFPRWGWMEPLNHTEYGVHNLMCTMFVIVFFTQNIFGKSLLLKVLFTFILLGFIFSTIGCFADSTGVKKTGGIVNFITALIAYYDGFGMIINQKRNKITMPLFDGKKFGDKLD